ncbi:MAG: S8 family serine peptidase [Nitrospirota bacterium]
MESIKKKRHMMRFAMLITAYKLLRRRFTMCTKYSFILTALVLLTLPIGTTFGEPAETLLGEVPIVGMDAPNAIPDRYIVVFKDEVLVPEIESLADEVVKVHRGKLHFTYNTALRGFAATIPAKALAALQRNPHIAYIEADRIVSLPEPRVEDVGLEVIPEMQAQDVQAQAVQVTPPWGLDRIDRRDLPMDWQYTYNLTGTGVSVYVIDTGIRKTHMEFIGRVDPGYSTIYDGRWTNDCNGHGTHVAGTVGGSTYGVAKNVRVVPVRVLDCYGYGDISGVIGGVDWVTSNHIHPAVANMSLGVYPSSLSLDDAVQKSIAHGVTYVVAAGNDASSYKSCYESPADVYEAITVGATDQNDWRASFSNYGYCVDIYAPGNQITSAYNGSDTDKYTLSGTSMAAPHVAGVAALLLQRYPNYTPEYVAGWLIDAYATPGHIQLLDSNSWNYLLYSRVDLTEPPYTPDWQSGISIINSLPASISLDTTEYTTSWDDPTLCAGSPSTGGHTAWFYYLPTANGSLNLDTFGSNYNTILAVFNIDSGTGDLIRIACNDNAGGGYQSQITNVPMTGAKPLIIEVASYYGTSGGGNLVLHVSAAPSVTSFAINNGASSTASRNVTLNNSCTGSPTHYMASESSSFRRASWQTYSTAPSFTLSSGNGTKTVYFKVKNSTGESQIYLDSIVLTSEGIPVAPSNLTLTVITGGLQLNWTDNSNNETGFKIERCIQKFIGYCTLFSQIATVGQNITSYTMGKGKGPATYYFRVKAYNASGDSPPSNTVSIYIP